MAQPITKPMEESKKRNIGSPKERVEDLRLLRGKGIYVDDIKKDNTLHVSILRSPIAHGIIKNIHVDEAKNLAGVIAVLTAKEILDSFGDIPKIALSDIFNEGFVYFESINTICRNLR